MMYASGDIYLLPRHSILLSILFGDSLSLSHHASQYYSFPVPSHSPSAFATCFQTPSSLCLLHSQYWALSGTPLGHPIVALCHVHPEDLGLQDQPLHGLQQIIDGKDVGVSQLIILVLGLDSCSAGQPTSSLLSSPPG